MLTGMQHQVGGKYEVVKTSAANQTWLAQLTELYSAYSLLSTEEAATAIIMRGDFRVFYLFQTSGLFGTIYTDTNKNVFAFYLDLANKKVYAGDIRNTLTETPNTDTTSQKLTLCRLKN